MEDKTPVQLFDSTGKKVEPKAALDEPTYPDVKICSNGKVDVLATIDNLMALMEYCSIRPRYDLISKRVEVWSDDLKCLDVLRGDDGENSAIAMLESKAALFGLPVIAVTRFFNFVAQAKQVNPVCNHLGLIEHPIPFADIQPMDPVALGRADPIKTLIDIADIHPKSWAYVALRRWFIQAVAAADHGEQSPNRKARPEFPYVLVLIGEQGVGKTSLIHDLLPTNLQSYFSAGRMLDTNNKDSVTAAVSNWIVELGEIDSTFRRSDIAALKAHLTSQWDEIRRPYARSSSRLSRRTAYVATVNHPKFLQDETGNRRFWPIEIRRAVNRVPPDLIRDLWGMAARLYLDGEQWWLTPEEEYTHLGIVKCFEDKPLLDRLRDCYDFTSSTRNILITMTEILGDIRAQNDRSAQSKVGIHLSELGIEKTRQGESRMYAMPPRTSANAYTV